MPAFRTLLAVLVLFFGTAAWPAGIEGTYRIFKDSNGTTPKAGAVVELTFAKSTFTLKAVMPSETMEDKGTYRLIGNTSGTGTKNVDQGKSLCSSKPHSPGTLKPRLKGP